MKQAWRTLKEENSLLHNVYKARYFSHTHLFYAKLGYNPSYVWREIFDTTRVKARLLVEHRYRNDSQCLDRPINLEYTIKKLRRVQDQILYLGSGDWNRELVYCLFPLCGSSYPQD